MKRTKLNAIIKAIACGTISLSFTPHLHGQQFGGQYNSSLDPMSNSLVPAPITGFGTPLIEQEIPGSSRNLGPAVEQVIVPQIYSQPTIVSPAVDSFSPAGEIIVDQDPIFDGKTVFPLGTFPAEGFGEKIISEFSTTQSNDGTLIPGTFEPVPVPNDGVENGIPIDQIVQPDIDVDMASDDLTTIEDLSVTEESTQLDSADSPMGSESKATAKTPSANAPGVSVVETPSPSIEAAPLARELESQLAAIKKQKAKIETQIAMMEAKSLQSKAQFNAKLKLAEANLTTAKAKAEKKMAIQRKIIAQQKQSLTKLQKQLQQSQKDAQALQKKLTQQAKQQQTKSDQTIAGLKKELKTSNASALELKQQLKTAQADIVASQSALTKAKAKAQSQAAAMKAKMAAMTAAMTAETQRLKQSIAASDLKIENPDSADSSNSADASQGSAKKADSPTTKQSAKQGDQARQKRESAKAEVKRKLAQREAALKKLKSDQENQDDAPNNEKADAAKPDQTSATELNALEKKILALKTKRDQQIQYAEGKIRTKQQAEIDDLIAAGNAEDSEVVTEAKSKLTDAVASSREKLKSRYRRKIEKLKQSMGKN